MKARSLSRFLMAAFAGMTLCSPLALAQAAKTCTADDFAAAVDKSGAALRTLTLEAQPKLQARVRRYGELKRIDASRYEDVALDAIQDARLKTLNEKSASLVFEIDTLGRADESGALDCGKLDEIDKRSSALLALMREKSNYMLARLDAKIREAGETPPTQAGTSTAKANKKVAGKDPATPKPANATTEPARKNAGGKDATADSNWHTMAKANPDDAYSPPPRPADRIPTADASQYDDGYSIEEIRDATKGFFGTISTNLATVIEHSFKTWGRPTAYVLGTEGGGAFFAGLRFGKGTLFMRHRSLSQPIYWHGPSLGTDLGAAGSQTMFLIYKLDVPQQLYRSFTGVDGSAYLVGGVGVTLLKGGDVIMAPIRSGLGLRLGANIGYLRFSDHATWNPF